jgi:hypothetical protein
MTRIDRADLARAGDENARNAIDNTVGSAIRSCALETYLSRAISSRATSSSAKVHR